MALTLSKLNNAISMTTPVKYGIIFLGSGVFSLLIGLGLDSFTAKEENVKYSLLFLGLSIICLYVGITWKKPSYGGGVVHKYGLICFGFIFGLYSIYLLAKLL